jgi:hypothetical protein
MKASILQSTGYRPLLIDFDLHTDGDAEFKKELIELMIDNIRELQQALRQGDQQKDPQFFSKACHKVKATLSMLNDQDLLDVVADLSAPVYQQEKRQEQIALLNRLCEETIKSLQKEGA